MPTPAKKKRSRPSAFVRAEHGGAAALLTASERQVFGEALRLEAFFDNDAAAALDAKTKNPVCQELVALTIVGASAAPATGSFCPFWTARAVLTIRA